MNWPVKDGCDVVGIVTKIKRNKLNPRDPELPEFSYEVLVAEQTFFVWEVDIMVFETGKL